MIPLPSRRLSRIFQPPKRYLGILIEDLEKAFLVIPKIYDETMLDVDSKKWMEAMKSEIDFMHFN